MRVIGRMEPATDDEPETVLLGVKDQGLGLSETELKKVGTLFRARARAARGKQGTGIGLYLVTASPEGINGKLMPESDGAWQRLDVLVPLPAQAAGRSAAREEIVVQLIVDAIHLQFLS